MDRLADRRKWQHPCHDPLLKQRAEVEQVANRDDARIRDTGNDRKPEFGPGYDPRDRCRQRLGEYRRSIRHPWHATLRWSNTFSDPLLQRHEQCPHCGRGIRRVSGLLTHASGTRTTPVLCTGNQEESHVVGIGQIIARRVCVEQ